MSVTAPQPAVSKQKLRWNRPTLGHLILALLVVEGLLWLSDRLSWPTWHKGCAVLTAVAAVGAAMILMLLCWIAALVFRVRFQFGVGSLLALTVAVAVPCGWLKWEMDKAERQRQVTVVIERVMEANVALDCDATARPFASWLFDLFGADFFGNPVDVLTSWAGLPDKDLACLVELPTLRTLSLCSREVTDAGLGCLKDLHQLEAIQLVECHSVTDAGLANVQSLSNLQTLSLRGTNVTDAGLEYLKHLSSLQYLDITDTKVTDQGVKKLQQALPNCRIER